MAIFVDQTGMSMEQFTWLEALGKFRAAEAREVLRKQHPEWNNIRERFSMRQAEYMRAFNLDQIYTP